jgi:hypothetical protein
MHPSVLRLLILIVAIVLAALIIHSRSAFGL